MDKVIIGSRGSELAMVQSRSIRDMLRNRFPHIEFEIKKIKTTGDKILDAPLSKIGDKGLFTKEIENELLDGTIDLAVHSMKDMPTMLPDGLVIGAVTDRLNPRDVFISKNGLPLKELMDSHTIATSSLRRRAQLLQYRSGINLADMRGNVISRIRKMRENPEIDGIVLAYAGVARLNMVDTITEIVPEDILLPPVGQATLAIEIRDDNGPIREIVDTLNNRGIQIAVLCERAFLTGLHGGCQVPIAGYAELCDGTITMSGMVASLDGQTVYRDTVSGPAEKNIELGHNLAQSLLDAGARKILEDIYGHELK